MFIITVSFYHKHQFYSMSPTTVQKNCRSQLNSPTQFLQFSSFSSVDKFLQFSTCIEPVVVVVVRPSLSTMTNDITGLNKTWCDESCCG